MFERLVTEWVDSFPESTKREVWTKRLLPLWDASARGIHWTSKATVIVSTVHCCRSPYRSWCRCRYPWCFAGCKRRSSRLPGGDTARHRGRQKTP